MNIVVLCGGISTERDVSISTGKLVYNSLLERGHKVLLLDVYMGLENDVYQSESNVFELGAKGLNHEGKILESDPDIESIKELRDAKVEGFFGENVLAICKRADIVFIALHGENGENGRLQATFDLLGIKYTGTGYSGSMMAMDKDITKKILIGNDILTPKQVLDFGSSDIRYPLVVKPTSGGSSIGVTIVNNHTELQEALKTAQKYDSNVIVEEYVKGREFSVGILGSEVLPVIEIVPKEGFYDYKNKYQAGFAEEICPASLDKMITEKMQSIAFKIYKSLNLEVYSRIDFILSQEGEIFCLEANTLPGMTPTSLLPQEAKVLGMSHSDVCEKIIELSLKKY